MLYDGDETDNDVDEIVRTLRVFCVSSMDYQNITSSETEEPRVGWCGELTDLCLC